MFTTNIEFLTGNAGLVTTGDLTTGIIIALLILAAISLGVFCLRRKKIKLFASVSSVFLVFAICGVAFAETSIKDVGVPEKIYAKIDASNQLGIDKCTIANNGDTNIVLRSLSMSLPNDNSTWTIKNKDNVIFNKQADGTQTNVPKFIIKAGEAAELAISTDMSLETARSFNGKTCTLNYNIDYSSKVEAKEPTVVKDLVYNGQPQTGIIGNDTIELSGPTSATDAGTYQVTAEPKDENFWPDKTTAPKTYQWTIAKAQLNPTKDKLMDSYMISLDASEDKANKTFNIYYPGDEEGTISGLDQSIVTASLSGNKLALNPVGPGETKGNIHYNDCKNYSEVNIEFSVFVTQHFTGKLYYPLIDDEGNLDIFDSVYNNMSFDWNPYNFFFEDNTEYNKQFAKLGICLNTNSFDGCRITLDGYQEWNIFDADTLFEHLGMTDIRKYSVDPDKYEFDKDDTNTYVLAHKKITINGQDSELLTVTICGTGFLNKNELASDLDVGIEKADCYDASAHPEWTNHLNHKGFDVTYHRISDKIKEYINTYLSKNSNKSIFINGHSRGAAIANLLGKEYEENPDYKSFSYCFATPTVTQEDNYASYKTIFNINNDGDLVPMVPLAQWGFHKLGRSMSANVGDKEYQDEWNAHTNHKYVDYDAAGLAKALPSLAKTRKDLYTIDQSIATPWSESYDSSTEAQEALNSKIAKMKEYELDQYVQFKGPEFKDEKYHVSMLTAPTFIAKCLSNAYEYAKKTVIIEEFDIVKIIADMIAYFVDLILQFDNFPLFSYPEINDAVTSRFENGTLVPGFVSAHGYISYYLLADKL